MVVNLLMLVSGKMLENLSRVMVFICAYSGQRNNNCRVGVMMTPSLGGDPW